MARETLSEVIDFDLSLIDKSYDDRLFGLAKKIRIDTAKELDSAVQCCDYTDIEVTSGMLNAVLERNPFENTKKVLQYNIFMTRMICDKILNNPNLSVIEKIGLYAFVVELGARDFLLPGKPETTKPHLGAAKERGFFFTPPSVAIRMVALSLKYNKNSETVFDPACGAGVFLAYSMVFNHNLKKVVGVELDAETAFLAQKLLSAIQQELAVNVSVEIECSDFFEYFNRNADIKYNAVIMNPPYGSVKFLATDLTDVSTHTGLSETERNILAEQLRDKTLEYASRLRKQFEPYGMGKGTLEYSKLFMAAMHELVDDNGFVVSITPSSWLGDESSYAFRKAIIENGYLQELWIIPEMAKLFKGVNQPTCISVIRKNHSSVISFSNPVLKIEDGEFISSALDLKSVLIVAGDKVKFPKCNNNALNLLVKLQAYGKFGDLPDLVNARGELDLTAFKQYVSVQETGHRLIRGDHIDGWYLKNANQSDKSGYVKFDEFIESLGNSSKIQYIQNSRIAIPQCSYLQKKKRVEAAIVPPGCVIANSCNFLLIQGDNTKLKEYYYWAITNSSVNEWKFRIFSYNNHVANTEISLFTCIPFEELETDALEKIVCYFEKKDEIPISKLDAFVATTLGLSCQEYEMILRDIGVEEREQYMNEFYKLNPVRSDEVGNHTMPSLSKLDRVMIGYVEPGGNWTSIPDTVPSKRLEQIREMAKTRGMVRTTYYSRLRYDQPSYTISTYFNRPGNGANIHPWENRTLSCREAARLQSFPDSFVFEGTEAAVRTQIGNAVPPLLGYSIGKAIMKKMGDNILFCDMFAGAGGLSYGLELAGFMGVAALELNKYAAETFARNHSKTIKTIVGDINDKNVQDDLIETITSKIGTEQPWVLVGGPPCQGFSTAGYRDENDVRNKLVDTYLTLITKLQPTVVVMENVPGILSMSKGQVIKGVYDSLGKLGYHCTAQPWVVDAERYGVPQMRKRVIIVAAKEEKYLPDFPEPMFRKCLGRREPLQETQMSMTLERYPITVGEAFIGLPALMPINEYYPNNVTIDTSYSQWCRGEITIEELFQTRGKL